MGYRKVTLTVNGLFISLKLHSDLKNIPTFLNFRGQFRILLLIEFPFVYPVKNYQLSQN